jgi:hypothetical protein
MNNKEIEMPDLFVSAIRSINSQTPRDWSIEQRTWHPKSVQEELKKFITELMTEWRVEEKWGAIEKLNIPKAMSRYASTYYGFLRFKNRSAHPMIANQLNGVLFNDGRLTVELNKYPPRDIHMERHSEITFKYNPQLKQRYEQQGNNEDSQSRATPVMNSSPTESEDEFDIVTVIDSQEKLKRNTDMTDSGTQADTVTEEMNKMKETIKRLNEKLSQAEEQLQELHKTKAQLNMTVTSQAKKLGDLSEENQSYREVINKLKVAFLSTD